MFNNIAYLPIDIEVDLPNESEILEHFHAIGAISDHMPCASGLWKTYPIFGRMLRDEWNDVDIYQYHKKHSSVLMESVGQYYDNFDTKFPQIASVIDQLPYKQLSLVMALEQTSDVPIHKDREDFEIVDDDTKLLDPKRYNILLTKHEYKSFFLSENDNGDKIYPKIDKGNPVFCLSHDKYYHGATMAGPGKVMVAIGGIIDVEKHNSLLEQSFNKFEDQSIIFDQ